MHFPFEMRLSATLPICPQRAEVHKEIILASSLFVLKLTCNKKLQYATFLWRDIEILLEIFYL